MIGGQVVEYLHHGHHVPTHGTGPGMLRLSGFLISPESGVGFVPCVLPEAGLSVEGALVSLHNLVDNVLVGLLYLLRLQHHGSSFGVEGKSHEDAVEPHLISVDGFVPEHAFLGARLILQLLEERLEQFEILFHGIELVHGQQHLAWAHVVEVEVFVFVTLALSVFVNHLGGIFLQPVVNGLVFVGLVGVEHGAHLGSYGITPARLLGKVEVGDIGHAGHFRVRHPFRVTLIWLFSKNEAPVNHQVVEVNILSLSGKVIGLAVNALELTIVYIDIVDCIGQRISLVAYDHYAIL